jgi:hypothetical protein
VSDEVRHAARLLMGQYGDDGAIIAIMRAAEAAAIGDIDVADYWEKVASALETLESGRPDA